METKGSPVSVVLGRASRTLELSKLTFLLRGKVCLGLISHIHQHSPSVLGPSLLCPWRHLLSQTAALSEPAGPREQ